MDQPKIDWVLGLGLGFAVSWLLTGAMRHYALRIRLLDHPNERSAHLVPTPRGGGVGIVLSFSAFVTLCISQSWLEIASETALYFLLGSGLVAAIGFLDDRRHVPARWRLFCHSLGALCCIWGLGLRQALNPTSELTMFLWLGTVMVSLVWMVNLCNFMDGIDGIAGVQAVTVCVAASSVAWMVVPDSNWWLPLAFAGCVTGFLFWNFPPARIFMGDVGSGYMGLVLGFLSVHAALTHGTLLWVWLILMGCFVTDATLTLVRRVVSGEPFYEAHRLHAYQYAARYHGSHRKVTLAIAGLNIFWLLPLAMAVGCHKLSVPLGLLLTYGPLTLLAWRYKAGNRKGQAGQ